MRSWPTSVTQPVTRPPGGKASSTAAWRSSTSATDPLKGWPGTSHPHVPTAPRMPDTSMAAPTRSGWATVPASITVVTPLRRLSEQDANADTSSSWGPWWAWSGMAHSKIA